jgi:tRNA modification GTPase
LRNLVNSSDTIVALATPQGLGAIAVIRLSGPTAITICNQVFSSNASPKKDLENAKSHTLHFGSIHDGDILLDEVLVSVFKNPRSYTGENTVEVSCHGSVFIQQQLINLFVRKGARMAEPGEFTFRAFMNGKMDLSQAEAVADLISSRSASSHLVAMQQMRGGFSNEIKLMRDRLIDFASLIELELDFSEEDVEFANRTDLKKLVLSLQKTCQHLIGSFELGNVIKTGLPVAIVGKPNVGKSTLLNVLLNDNRAIVSEIAGTTRDTIEDEITIGGHLFRFIDTAGIRETTDVIEAMGVAKTWEKIKQAALVIYMFDVHEITAGELTEILSHLSTQLKDSKAKVVLVANKMDHENPDYIKNEFKSFKDILFISARAKQNIDALISCLLDSINSGAVNANESIVTNARHVAALNNTNQSLQKVYENLNQNIPGDLLAVDIRTALHFLGEITGEVSTDDLLGNIFSKFCIGK